MHKTLRNDNIGMDDYTLQSTGNTLTLISFMSFRFFLKNGIKLEFLNDAEETSDHKFDPKLCQL